MATLGEYLGAGSGTTKLLLHLNGNSTDSSGNGNNGVDTAITYSQANGKFGQGAGFGSSNSTIALGYTAPTDNYTYSLWIKPTDYTAQRSLIHNMTDASSGRNIYIALKQTTGYVFVDIPFVKDDILISPSAPTTSVWTNIILTRSGSAWRLYFNGSLVKSATDSTSQQSTTSCRIGNINTQTITFGGAIDEVIVENTAWSAEKVKKYYTFTKGRFGII